MDGWLGGWVCGWMDGWVDGGVDGLVVDGGKISGVCRQITIGSGTLQADKYILVATPCPQIARKKKGPRLHDVFYPYEARCDEAENKNAIISSRKRRSMRPCISFILSVSIRLASHREDKKRRVAVMGRGRCATRGRERGCLRNNRR